MIALSNHLLKQKTLRAWTSIVSGLEGYLQFLQRKGHFPKLKNNSFQHNFGTFNGEKLTDTILEAEMSIENKETFLGGTKCLFG